MKRALLTTMVTLLLACLTATTASAQNPHYLRLNVSIDSTDLSYDVNLKEAGLGTATTITYILTATAVFQVQCFTKSGNPVSGVVKSGPSTGATQTTLNVSHGQTTGIISLDPNEFTLPDPGCTGNQEARVISASYTNVKLNDGQSTATGFSDTFCDTAGICLPPLQFPAP